MSAPHETDVARLSGDEREVLRIKWQQSGMDSAFLYFERILAGRVSEWRDAAETFSDDYHAELTRRIKADQHLGRLMQRIEAWIRHGEAVPADVTTYERWIVHAELRDLLADVRAHLGADQ